MQSPEITSHCKGKCYTCQPGRVSVFTVSVCISLSYLLPKPSGKAFAARLIDPHGLTTLPKACRTNLVTMSTSRPQSSSEPLLMVRKTAAVLPLLASKQRKTHANDWMSSDALVACPDPNCPSVLKITRTGARAFSRAQTTIVSKEGNSGSV